MNNYLKYMEQVLGVRNLIVDRAEVLVPNIEVSNLGPSGSSFEIPAFFYSQNGPVRTGHDFIRKPFVILNFIDSAEDSVFVGPVAELFRKMKAALKISDSDIQVLDCVMNDRNIVPAEFQKICEAQCVLMFSRQPQKLGEAFSFGGATWIETYSPAKLIEDANLKKQTWNDMQKMLSFFQR